MDCWVGPRPRIPSRPALACNQPVLCRSEQFGRRGRGSLSQRIGFSLLDMFHSCSGSAKKRRQQVLVTLYARPLIQTSPSMWVQTLSPSLPLSLSPSAFFSSLRMVKLPAGSARRCHCTLRLSLHRERKLEAMRIWQQRLPIDADD